MDKTKVEQIRDKICDHMLATDLTKLSWYDMTAYINAYRALEGGFSFPSFGLGSNLVCSVPDTDPSPATAVVG